MFSENETLFIGRGKGLEGEAMVGEDVSFPLPYLAGSKVMNSSPCCRLDRGSSPCCRIDRGKGKENVSPPQTPSTANAGSEEDLVLAKDHISDFHSKWLKVQKISIEKIMEKAICTLSHLQWKSLRW